MLSEIINILLKKYIEKAENLNPLYSDSDALLYSFIAGFINDLGVLKKCDELLSSAGDTD